MNKKAQSGDFLSIGYFMFLVFLIGATIFLMSKLVLGVAYDSRLTDASLLSHKIENCFSEQVISLNTISEVADLERTCKVKIKDRNFVLDIHTDDKILLKYGDIVSCGLYELNKKNARCVQFMTKSKLNGQNTEIYVTIGSNLDSFKMEEE